MSVSKEGQITQGQSVGGYFNGEPPAVLVDFERRKETEKLSQAIVNNYTAHDLWVKRHAPNDVFVDMYATKPQDPTSIKPIELDEALDRFTEHRVRVSELGLTSHIDTAVRGWIAIDRNLLSVITFQQERERVARGEPKMPFYELHDAVNSYRPRRIPPTVLDSNRVEMFKALSDTGVYVDPNSQASIDRAYDRYMSLNRAHSRQEVEDKLYGHAERFKTHLARALGEDLSEVDFKIIWKYRNQFWKFWERPDVDGNYLWGNWHQRHVNEYEDGILAMYGYHELVHMIVNHFIAKQIKEGKLDPAVGIFPIPSAVSFQMEGVAQTVRYLASLPLNNEGKFAEAKYRMEKRSLANGLYEIEVLGKSIEDVTRDHQKYQPFKTPDQIRQSLEEGTTLPFERAYTRVYGDSDYDFTKAGEDRNLGPNARVEFLARNLSTPMIREQIMTFTFDLDRHLGYETET